MSGTPRLLFAAGCASGFVAVAAGAFGAHALRARLEPEFLAVYEVGVRYQIMHALGMLAMAWGASRWPGARLVLSGWLFAAGTVLFSGSLYALALSGVRALGAVTPVGGALFLAGWANAAWGAWRAKS